MSGAIQTKHLVKHISGGPLPPGGFAPGGIAWLAGSGSTEVVGPSYTDALPAPAAEENTALAQQWRAYHNGITARNAANGVGWWIYHENRIWQNDAPPTWSVAHTIGDQTTDRDSGEHSGLYVVNGQRTGKPYVVGLYRNTSDQIGFVQQDPDTGTWTSGAAYDPAGGAVGFNSNHFFGWAVPFKGRLWAIHSADFGFGSGRLLCYDPELGTVLIFAYNGAHQDWLHVQNGRLFLIRRDSASALWITEVDEGLGLLFNRQVQALGLTSNSANAGGHSAATLSDDSFVVFYYTTTGGTGWRADKVEVDAVPGSAPVLTDLTAVIPDGSDLNVGDMSWPAGGAAHDLQVFLPTVDCSEWPRGAFGTAGGAFASFHVQAKASAATKFTGSNLHLAWVDEVTPMPSGSPTWLTFQDGRYSWPGDRWGRGDRDYGGSPGPWLLAAEPYRDGTVTNGLLLTIKHAESSGRDAEDLQVLYGYPIGQKVGPGFTPCTLSEGDGIDVGGTAVLNVAEKSLDQLVGDFAGGGGTPRMAVLQHGAVLGPGFVVGETVTDGTSGATGEVLAVLAAKNRVSVRVNTGADFGNGNLLTGGTSGSNAVLAADQDLVPVYQVIWDLDADGLVPNGDFAEISIVSIPASQARPPGAIDDYFVGPVHQVSLLAVDDFEDPDTSFGPVDQPLALTDAAPTTNYGPVDQPLVLGDAAPTTSFGPVDQVLAETDNTPNPSRPVDARAYTQGGGTLGVQVGGVEIGVRAEINFNDPTGPALPGQALVPDPALPDGPKVTKVIDGVFELGRAVFNAEDFPADSTFLLADLGALGLDAIALAGIKVRAVTLDTVTTPPDLAIGANGTWDDQVTSAASSLVAEGEVEELALLQPRPILTAADELRVRLVTPATATDFAVEVIAYGHETQ